MALKSAGTGLIPVGGADTQLGAPINRPSSIKNMRWDPNNGVWRSDRGLKPYWQFPSSFQWIGSYGSINPWLSEKVDALFFWTKGGTGSSYLFVEQGGTLYMVRGNKGQGTGYSGSYFFGDIEIIGEGRNVPKTSQVGTQFIPWGNNLLIINGVDEPIWVSDEGDYRAFSFTLATPQPDPLGVQTDYLGGAELLDAPGAPGFGEDNLQGLGSYSSSTKNVYYYKMTYLTEDGAQSPLSSPVLTSWTADSEDPFKYGVVLTLPPCPNGVHRRLWRTKNVKLDGETTYYFLNEITDNSTSFYIDTLNDSNLVSPAPNLTDSIVIDTDYALGENWDNRMWLARDVQVIYSESGIPEEFDAFSQFNLGNSVGGKITGLQAYYNNLLVFRETSISIIRKTNGGYSLSTLSSNIGTNATNAITLVPGLGVVFVNHEGVWAISGGLDGGSSVSIERISKSIDSDWSEINVAALRKTIAAYSPLEKELWIHYPTDGYQYANKGVVLHMERDQIDWSFRTDMPAAWSAVTVLDGGEFLWGSVPQWSNNFSLLSTGPMGVLHVWCATSDWGQKAQVTAIDPPTFTVTTADRPLSQWESVWISYPNGRTRIFSVEIELLLHGDTKLDFYYKTDFNVDWTSVTPQKMTDTEVVFTKNEEPVTVITDDGTITKNPFYVAQSQIRGARIIKLRYDTRTELCKAMKFKLEGNGAVAFSVKGYHLNVDNVALPVLTQSINLGS